MVDIKGYKGLYAVTSCGKVWSYRKKKFLKPDTGKRGYQRVSLSKQGEIKRFLVHRLVAEAYIPNPNNYDTVDHIDGCPTHNYIKNLQWMTLKDNVIKGNSGLKNAAKKVRCIETGEVFVSLSSAAENINKVPSAISQAINRKGTSGGYHWEWIE